MPPLSGTLTSRCRSILESFTARLERRRNRPIRLVPFTSAPGMPCGLWVSTAEADYVYYERGTTRFHAGCIALHEIAHMLLGHDGPHARQDLARLMAPGVHPSLVTLILGRSAYATSEEREAETLASRILDGTTLWPGFSGRLRCRAGEYAQAWGR